MRLLLKPALVAGVLILVLSLGWLTGPYRLVQAQLNQEIAPFTAHATERIERPDGSVSDTKVKVMALRSDGSYAEADTRINHARGTSLTRVLIFDTELGRRTDLYPSIEARTTYRFDDDHRAPSIRCSQEILDAPEGGELLGYRVVEVGKSSTRPDQSVSTTRLLYAPELNCLLLYRESTLTDKEGMVLSRNVYQVDSVAPGEPSASYFQVPAGYEELPPSVAEKRAIGEVNPAAMEWLETDGLNGLIKADTFYHEHKW